MTERSGRPGEISPAVAWGLLAAFAVHDLEELAMMPGWAAAQVERLRARHPEVPERVWSALRVTPAHAATAIGLMGLVVGGAAADGARTGGRSPFFQTVVAGFGLHAVSHVAQSAALGRYTPGVVTAPLVVAPYALWARRASRRAGVLREVDARGALTGALAFPLAIAGVHAAAFGIGRLARSRRSRRVRVTPRGARSPSRPGTGAGTGPGTGGAGSARPAG